MIEYNYSYSGLRDGDSGGKVFSDSSAAIPEFIDNALEATASNVGRQAKSEHLHFAQPRLSAVRDNGSHE